MNKLIINLENCYGIKKLKYNFDFTKKNTYSIYAPNGIMKTSFANTFMDLSNGMESKDLIFKGRKTKRIINDENNAEVSKEQVFVIEPYNKAYKSNKISTLLVNKELKEKYEQIHFNIDEKKELLIKELKPLSGLKANIEETFSNDFTHYPKEFFKAILRVKEEVLDKAEPVLENIVYQKIFSEKVVAFLETKDFKTKLSGYIDKYNELIDSSTYFKKGVFNHNNATTIAKNLKDNGFFQAKHSVSLNAKEKEKNRVITTEAELEEVIKQEKDSILKNPDLVKAFEEIDVAITKNKELKDFRDYLETNPSILPELENLNGLKGKLWISYLKRNIEAYKALESEYSNGKKEIEIIVVQAKKEETQWRKVIDEFNKRFSVPFKLSVDNQEDVILKSEGPNIKFVFEDFKDTMPIEEEELFKVLSSGERRALYILNIIFEVEARKQNKQETLFVVDDIADSFDYKNKYAIIQYLKEISEEPIFYQIILTHNFDFFRTVESREVVDYPNCLFSYKTENEIKLGKASGIKNPFINDWKQNLTNLKKLVAAIPFVRNIIEYTKGEDDTDYKKLTSLLHWKDDSESFFMSSLKGIFENNITGVNFPTDNLTDKVVDKIFQEAESCLIASEGINFENKIVLSIAIRLKAEKFMVNKINDPSFVSSITSNQTIALFKKCKSNNPSETENLNILEQVNLMTPENIHLNSFMYEPILDMSDQHLRDLYQKVKTLS